MRCEPPFALIVGLLLGAGCSSAGASSSDIDQSSLVSQSGVLQVDITSEPGAAPVRGSNRIYFDVTAVDSGTPVEALVMQMVPFMPAMGHGSSSSPSSTELGAGRYEFDDVLLAMPGLWELRTTITGSESDYVAPRFDVP